MPFLIFYGVGTMIGGGFCALPRHISAEAGTAKPLALLVSGGLALMSACSFAELCSRSPAALTFFGFLATLSVLGFKLWTLA